MIINIDLHQSIYEHLLTEAKEKGLSIEELIRVMLGEHIALTRPRVVFPAVQSMRPMTDKIHKMTNLLINTMFGSGALKCPNCTMPLGSVELEKGECSKCEYKF